MRLVVIDATPTGRETARLLLDDVPNPVTLRELITHRVREEVARHHANPVPRPRRMDWEKQAAVALESFAHNGFFVFVGDRQVEDLNERLSLAETDEVSFVRLVPLVGG